MSNKAMFVLIGCSCVLVLAYLLAGSNDDSDRLRPQQTVFDDEQREKDAVSISDPFSISDGQKEIHLDGATPSIVQPQVANIEKDSNSRASSDVSADSAEQHAKSQEEIDREEMDPASESSHQLRLEQGFSVAASRALAESSGKLTVSILDMPPEIQDDLLSASRDIADLGYEEVEYEFLQSIADISLRLIDDAEIERVAAFTMTTPDEKFTEGYEMLGVSYPGAGERIVGDKSVETISHTYTALDSTNALHLVETSLINGSTVLLSEFKNAAVREYPAYFRVYRNSQSGEEVSGITWIDENFDTTLYYVGPNPTAAKEYLLSKAVILQDSRGN